ncbi:methyl-accepting chemotaxis protein [Clostridium sp. A1-XYC3]|uniref:Methyl-accepting chemotaxis protein n=1 Tax=Clostridium tanneri TaxID=3037988 RepID=A0ABU4JSE5_9CLOT|nr:methyl-accepting chemotaxis protein [Clostridium sp. A1-XYC3]MDW8800858.1 methyl-accepting chemotaxis protein [Clostridium sp. A1-XYC3]
MSRKVKNLKIATMVFFLNFLLIAFMLVIGIQGFWNMKTINNNMTSMYDDNLIPISRLGGIRGNFLNIRIQFTKAFFQYDTTVDAKIKEYDANVQKRIKEYESTNIKPEEAEQLKLFKDNYSEYMKAWEQAKIKLSKDEKLSHEDYKVFSDIGTKGEDILVKLRDYNENAADKTNKRSNSIYSNIVKLMLATFLISIVISLIVSYLILQIIKKSSEEMITNLETVSSGNFTINIDVESTNEFGIMKKSLSKTVSNISTIIKAIEEKSKIIDTQSENLSTISEQMSSSSENIASAIEDAARGTSSQTEELVNITAILNEFSEKLDSIVKAIKNVDVNSKGISSMANESNNNMNILIESVSEVSVTFKEFIVKISSLGEDINKINEITTFINSISDQTNLLALNAAIEAARAGEAGKGFSVVAEEIRKLAEQSKASLENINKLVKGISDNSNIILNSTDKMNKELNNQMNIIDITTNSFKTIIEAINAIIPQITHINTSTIALSADKNVILEKIESSSSISEEISASTEQVSASAEEMSCSSEEVASSAQKLSKMTKEMMEQVNRFKL